LSATMLKRNSRLRTWNHVHVSLNGAMLEISDASVHFLFSVSFLNIHHFSLSLFLCLSSLCFPLQTPFSLVFSCLD
jgi:hypothetical protein